MVRRFFAVLLFLFCSTAGLAARLEGWRVEQTGDRLLHLTFTGRELSEPLVNAGTSALDVTFFGVSEQPEGALLGPAVKGAFWQQGSGRVTLRLDFALPVLSAKAQQIPEGWLLTVRLRSAALLPPPQRAAPLKGAVSLTLKNAPLAEALHLLADQLGVNLIFDGGDENRLVTLQVVDAPAAETLSLLLSGSDLSWAMVGKTVVVGRRDALASNLGRVNFRDFRLYHGNPTAVAEALRPLLGSGATVTADERARRVYVTGDAGAHERAAAALMGLDAPMSQVAIKARIVEVSDEAGEELESVLDAVYRNFFLAVSQGAGLFGFQSDGAAGRAVEALDLQLKALISRGQARLLADPTVVTLEGQPAVIKLVDRVKYISRRDEGKNPTYHDEDVGPQLQVTPYLDGLGNITVDLELRTGEITQWKRGGQGEEVPQISEREVKTTVRVPDGTPFVVGGLHKENRSELRSKTPFFGDLPLIGGLFQSKTIKTSRGQVVMILLPFILDDTGR